MSLVGPAALALPREPALRARGARAGSRCGPGITGLWQVCRHEPLARATSTSGSTTTCSTCATSFAVDLKILAATVLTGGGRRHVPLSWILPARVLGEEPSRARDIPAVRRRPHRPLSPAPRRFILRHAPHQDRRHHRARLARPAVLERCSPAGVDVVRLNFSHGEHARAPRGRSRPRARSPARRTGRSPCSRTCRGPRSAPGKVQGGAHRAARTATPCASPPTRRSRARPSLISTTYDPLPAGREARRPHPARRRQPRAARRASARARRSSAWSCTAACSSPTRA